MSVPQLRFSGFEGEWDIKKVKDIATVTSSKRVYLNDYVNNGIPFYRGKEITELKSGKTPEDLLYISKDKYEEFKAKFGAPVQGDILITAVGTIGNSMLVENNFDFYFKDGNLIWLREINQNPKFLLYVFSNPSGYRKLLDSASGSNQKALTIVGLNKLGYRMPKIEEQNKIASFFSLVDQKIQKQQEKIEKLEQFKKGMMQKIFSQELRFKDENGGEFAEWEYTTIGKEMEVGSCVRVHQEDWKPTGVPFYRARDIVAMNKGLSPEPLFISQEDYETRVNKSGRVRKGDVMVTGVGTIGVPFLIREQEEIYFKDGNVIWLKNNNKLLGEFLYYYILSEYVQKYIKMTSGIGTVGTYTIENAKKTPLWLPTEKEQVKIASYLSSIYRKIEKEKEKLLVLEEQKRGFMQGMFV